MKLDAGRQELEVYVQLPMVACLVCGQRTALRMRWPAKRIPLEPICPRDMVWAEQVLRS